MQDKIIVSYGHEFSDYKRINYLRINLEPYSMCHDTSTLIPLYMSLHRTPLPPPYTTS